MVSLVLTTFLLYTVNLLEWPTYAYAILVLVVVPPTTFILAKYWAFVQPGRIG